MPTTIKVWTKCQLLVGILFGWHFVRTPNCLTCCVVTPFVVAVICVVIITIVVVDILCCCHEIKKSLDVKLPHSFACLLDGTPQ